MDGHEKFVKGLRFYRLTAGQRRTVWIPVCVWWLGAVVSYLCGAVPLSKVLLALSAGYGSSLLVLRVVALSWNYELFINQGWRAKEKADREGSR